MTDIVQGILSTSKDWVINENIVEHSDGYKNLRSNSELYNRAKQLLILHNKLYEERYNLEQLFEKELNILETVLPDHEFIKEEDNRYEGPVYMSIEHKIQSIERELDLLRICADGDEKAIEYLKAIDLLRSVDSDKVIKAIDLLQSLPEWQGQRP